jgi:hypothetical protein
MHAQMPVRQPAALTSAELAVVKTVVYSSLFDYPLTTAEMRSALIHATLGEDDIERVYAASARLRRVLARRDGLFFLSARPDLPERRRARERTSRRLIGAHERLLRWTCAVPFARLVALSGSAAHLNMDEHADVDLFILTRGRRVWSVTLAVLLLAKLFRQRRTLCVNFVLSDESPAVDDRDLFTANQIIHLKPLIGHDALEAFVAANPFVSAWYPGHGAAAATAHGDSRTAPGPMLLAIKRGCEAALGFGGGAIAEWVSRALLRRYLVRSLRGCASPAELKLTPDCLKLHAASHREAVLRRFDVQVQATLRVLEGLE